MFRTCRREVEELHAFFVRWYCGTADPGAFARVEDALADSFERISPDGTLHDRAAVLAGVRERHDTHETFEIEIRNVEPVAVDERRALVRYEEWQQTPEGTTGRYSTALFAPVERGEHATDASRPAAEWRYLQETWLDPPG